MSNNQFDRDPDQDFIDKHFGADADVALVRASLESGRTIKPGSSGYRTAMRWLYRQEGKYELAILSAANDAANAARDTAIATERVAKYTLWAACAAAATALITLLVSILQKGAS